MATATRKHNRKTAPRKNAARLTVTAKDLNWGAIFYGSKAALQRAGLLPAKFKIEQEYQLPLDWGERYDKHVYSGWPRSGPMPRRWDAWVDLGLEPGTLEVHVKYDPLTDLVDRERVERALLVLADLAPPRLSELVPATIARREARHG